MKIVEEPNMPLTCTTYHKNQINSLRDELDMIKGKMCQWAKTLVHGILNSNSQVHASKELTRKILQIEKECG